MTTHDTPSTTATTGMVARRPAVGPGRLVAAGAVVLGIVVAIDRLLADRALAAEWAPETSWPYAVRSAGIALASALVVVGGRRLTVARLGEIAAGPPAADRLRPRFSAGVEQVVAGVGAAVALGSAVLLIVDPSALSSLVREDAAVEWASALLSFAAGGAVGLSAVRQYRHGGNGAMGRALVLVAVAGGFLLLGLEEVSWFQRVLDIESPEAFVNRNGQQETNLHNFATVATGNAYYIGAFVFTVAVPHLFGDRSLGRKLGWLDPVVPPRAVLLASVTAAGIVYEMWNVIWIQAIFWMSLAALVTAPARGDGSPRTERLLAAVMIATAAAYIGLGDTMIRAWDDTEVRELVIPFGLLVYGWAMLRTFCPVDERQRG
ncbi:MAG: hypothetical protein OEV40_02605 [Acidimicrobiia bacterium]|nr:hypothetical protein [Acidimicrobiia bacterium]